MMVRFCLPVALLSVVVFDAALQNLALVGGFLRSGALSSRNNNVARRQTVEDREVLSNRFDLAIDLDPNHENPTITQPLERVKTQIEYAKDSLNDITDTLISQREDMNSFLTELDMTRPMLDRSPRYVVAKYYADQVRQRAEQRAQARPDPLSVDVPPLDPEEQYFLKTFGARRPAWRPLTR